MDGETMISVLLTGLVSVGLGILSVIFDSIRYSLRFDPKIPDIRKLSNQSKY